jgi:prevent-host-death family protein
MLANPSRRARIVNMHEAKTHLSELVEAAERGERITIARNGEPAVILVPALKGARSPAGIYRGRLRVGDDFNEPLQDFSGVDEG